MNLNFSKSKLRRGGATPRLNQRIWIFGDSKVPVSRCQKLKLRHVGATPGIHGIQLSILSF